MKIIESKISKSRFMGVVLCMVHYSIDSINYAEFFNIEYSEFGLERHLIFKDVESDELKKIKKELFYPLGSEILDINPNFLNHFIRFSMNEKIYSKSQFKKLEIESHWFKSDIEYSTKIEKLTNELVFENIKTENELINLYFIRYFSNDRIYEYLCDEKYDFVHGIQDLILNHTTMENNTYKTTSLCLDSSYRIFEFEFEIINNKISNLHFIGKLEISSIEAALMLKKDYFLIILDASSIETHEFIENLIKKYPSTELSKNDSNKSIFLMSYNRDNNHLKKSTFRIDSDVFLTIIIDENGLLMISSEKQENLNNFYTWAEKTFKKSIIPKLSNQFTIEYDACYDYKQREYTSVYQYTKDNLLKKQ